MLKSTFDFIIALVLAIVLIPFWLLVLVVPKLSLFKQKRVGRYGKLFTIYKLKTMEDGKVIKYGHFLRKNKIDELPQIFNILKGEMSLVGPRPDMQGYYDCLTGDDRKILSLKPGLTSLAAIKYADEETLLSSEGDPIVYNDTIIFPDKVKMNLDYIKKKSFRYDLYIIGLTLRTIFVKNKLTAY